ncbi:uncharacterized protein [Haliotis asinina]|uniref:uncharacterized protein n=1 Tax=Haliotis asinina TaxID=109174 RepID=UPI003531E046
MVVLNMTEMRTLLCDLFVYMLIRQFIHTEGSLVLTSVPAAAATTDSDVITLICSSSWGRANRYWYRDEDVIFRTTESLPTLSKAAISNPYVYNKYLSGRISVSCGVLQHNVTLRINATIDRGTEWWCKDTVKSETSNHITLLSSESADLSRLTKSGAIGAKGNGNIQTNLGSNTVIYITAGSACAVILIIIVVAVLFVRRIRHRSGVPLDDTVHTVSSETSPADDHKQYQEPVIQGAYVHVRKDKVK